MKRKADLVIVTNEPFPIGMAATNRILSYAIELGKYSKLKILIGKPTESENNIRNEDAVGRIDSVDYSYVYGSTIWPKSAFRFTKALIMIKSYYRLFKDINIIKPKSILLVSNSLLLSYYLLILSKYINYNLFLEKSEKPPVLLKKSNILYRNIQLFSYRLYSGMIVMTNELNELFITLKQDNIFHLPMIVDLNRFEIPIMEKKEKKTIFKYCGGGNYERDGLHIMINAFIELMNKSNGFEFHIIGPIDYKSEYLKKIIDSIDKNKGGNYIKFIGKRNSNQIPKLLMKSDFLIMTPTEDFKSGGFPIKLGEYLATGRPVICTAVSEIPQYLNNDNSILVEPNSVDDLLDKLMEIIDNNKNYYKKGIKGKMVCEDHFTIKKYIKGLNKFLTE